MLEDPELGLHKRDAEAAEVNKKRMQNKGVRRFFEIFTGNFRDLVKLNLLFCICALPTTGTFLLGFFGVLTGVMYILSIIAAFPIGGAIAANMFCITKMLRDEPGFIWHDFKRKFKENYKQAAVPGILGAAFVYAQIFLWGGMVMSGGGIGIGLIILGVVVLLLFGMVAPYIFLQIAYIDLKTSQILKNSVLISFMNAPRSFMGAVTGCAVWAAFAAFLPDSLIAAPLIALICFSLSLLLCVMWIWAPVNKQFNIEQTLRTRAAP